MDGGVYRVNRVAKAAKGEPANEFGEGKVDLLTVESGEPKLPTTFVDYDQDPREYHLRTRVLSQTSQSLDGHQRIAFGPEKWHFPRLPELAPASVRLHAAATASATHGTHLNQHCKLCNKQRVQLIDILFTISISGYCISGPG